MSLDRKKVDKKPINSIVPKKREIETHKEEKKQNDIGSNNDEYSLLPKFIKQSVSETKNSLKFIRISLDADMEERKKISDKLSKNEIKLQFFGVDGNKSYHYYLEIKK